MTWGQFDETENKAVPPGRPIDVDKEIRPGDILLSRSNTADLVGASVLVGRCRSHLLLSDKSMRLLYSPVVHARWLQGALASPSARAQMSRLATGTSDSMRNISQDKVFSISLSLPPAPEQSRIAEALDELLSDLDTGIATLERIRTKLKSYRAAVLKAAVEGALTADWRAAHPATESADVLLTRILAERRRRWEESQLQKFKAVGKTPPKGWREKYQEPITPDITNHPNLPEGWRWTTVEQCSNLIQYGTSAKTGAESSGVPVIRMGNIKADGGLDLSELKYLPQSHEEFPVLLLDKGDLLFNRTNSAELVGKTGYFSGVPSPCSFASYLIRVKMLNGALPQVLAFALNGNFGRHWIKRVVTQVVGQANVNGSKLASFAFPLAPLNEQLAIVDAVEAQLSVIDHLDADIEAKLTSAQALRQSILRCAFAGELVSQDPADEPASGLLKRIAAERAERDRLAQAARSAPPSPARRRGRPRKVAV
jgi:type I restriction enzyme S subunit